MTRQEQNRLRRKRRNVRGLVLLTCMLLFCLGVSITFGVMQQVMGMPAKDSLISFGSMGQALKDITNEIPSISNRIQNTYIQLLAQVRYLMEGLRNWFDTLISY